jgi:alpha-L-fucosidase
MTNKLIAIIFLVFFTTYSFSQNTIHPTSESYEYPQDPAVAKNLEKWRDQKFGIIIHWGIYVVPGIIESWSICNEPWITRDSNSVYHKYKKWYWDLNKSFVPVRFKPDEWAQMAKDAGMKYVVFTTKHHDGFNMFDTKYSDYKISNGPFRNNPKANVAKHVFDAFRNEGMMIGAYYSKPDWHSQYFWWDRFATPDRNVNYDIRKFPWRWNQFVKYTHNQLNELTSEYGKIDILWLDGGWVRPKSTVNAEVLSWGAPIPEFDQEIDMPAVAKMVRKNQEDILIVDRTVHGPYENYRTPEQGIPADRSEDPWESCITLGGAWSYTPTDKFKPSSQVIHTLIEIVAKGGNLLLGVGPDAYGEFMPEQKRRLKEIGNWLSKYGEAIYETRTLEKFADGNIYFTQQKDKKTTFAIVLNKENSPLGTTVSWQGNSPLKGSEIMLVNSKTPLKWKAKNGITSVFIPETLVMPLGTEPAFALKFIRN